MPNEFKGMNELPVLVVGIGGVGCRIIATLSRLIDDAARAHVSLIGMDTNRNDLSKLNAHQIVTITTSDTSLVSGHLKKHPEYLKWFPVDRFIVNRGMENGAGQIRAISRLAAMKCEESGDFDVIRDEILRITKRVNKEDKSNVAVVIVGSITGGTGAGLFLHIPYMIRDIAKNLTGLSSIIIRGMFVGPDVTVGVQPNQINEKAVRVNAYACLRELNALYMTQTDEKVASHLELEHFHRGDDDARREEMRRLRESLQAKSLDAFDMPDDFSVEVDSEDIALIAAKPSSIPYDYLYLIENSNTRGGAGNISLPGVEEHAARMLHTLLFTPLYDEAKSVEDNFVLQDMQTHGMNRYAGVGQCALVYPADTAKAYVKTSAIMQMVSKHWLVIDNDFNSIFNEAWSRRKSDGTVVLPKLEEEYIRLFNERVTPNASSVLGNLLGEAFYEDETDQDNRQTRSPRSEDFNLLLDERIAEAETSDEVQEIMQACDIDETAMKTVENAVVEVRRVLSSLNRYAVMAKKIATERYIGIADRLFPTNQDSMEYQASLTGSGSIYSYLANVHPLTARFFVYNIIKRLRELIAENESGAAAYIAGAALDADYDPEEEGVQDPAAALRNIADKKVPVLNVVFQEEAKIAEFNKRFRKNTSDEKQNIAQYLHSNLTRNVCTLLLQRFELMAANYEAFFKEIRESISGNAAKLEKMENDLILPFNHIGVYCSKDALRKMADDYDSVSRAELPDKAKNSVFWQIFRLTAGDLARSKERLTEKQSNEWAADKKELLGNIFREAVEKSVEKDVEERAPEIVSLNIMEALAKEYELKTGAVERDSDEYAEKRDQYIRDKIQDAFGMAEPMISAQTNPQIGNAETVYLCLHPDCAVHVDNMPSRSETTEKYIPGGTAVTDGIQPSLVLKEDFARNEIICFRCKLKFAVEDLVKYRVGSENHQEYTERIAKLGTQLVNDADNDEHLAVVPPHLNRYWHEPWFLPSLHEPQRRIDLGNLRKAFVYGLGYDWFSVVPFEDPAGVTRRVTADILGDIDTGTRHTSRSTWKYDSPFGHTLIRMCGRAISASPKELFDALQCNTRIVKHVLRSARYAALREKGNLSTVELAEKIYETDLIEDLTQTSPLTMSGDTGERNILDIFLEMRTMMPEAEWSGLFDGLLEALWEYCALLFDENAYMVNSTAPVILGLVYKNSTTGKREIAKEAPDVGDVKLKGEVVRIRGMSYSR